MPITISPALIASLFNPTSATSSLFGQPEEDKNKNPQPEQANANEPKNNWLPPAQTNPQGVVPGSLTDQVVNWFTKTQPNTGSWLPPASGPKDPNAVTGQDQIPDEMKFKGPGATPQGTQPAVAPAAPIDPAMAAAQRGITRPPAPPADALLDKFGRAAANSKPIVPAASEMPAAPALGQNQTLADILAGSVPAETGKQPDAKSAIDWGKSDKNVTDASGLHAPIPARPITPGERDINPSTGRPFSKDEWNSFKAGFRPEDGRKFEPGEQQAYAKANNINLGSFSNNHNFLQNAGAAALNILSQMPARTSAYGGRSGPLPQYLQEQVKQGEDFFTNLASSKQAGREYDANKGAIQNSADIARAEAASKIDLQGSMAESQRANANLRQAQANNLGGDPNAVAADGKTPLMGQDYLTYIKTKNPGRAATLQAIMDYREDPTKISSMRSGERSAYFNEINRIDPNFDETKYSNRSALKKSFMSGKDADNLVAINTGVAHLSTANDLASKLQNGGVQAQNELINWVKTQLGHPEANNLQTAISAVSGELAKTFKSSGATDTEIEKFSKLFNPKESPAQFAGDLQTAQALMAGRLGAINGKWKAEFGEDYQHLLDDNSRSALTKMGPAGQTLLKEAGAGSQGNSAPAAAAAPTQGQKVRMVGPDGKTRYDVPADKVQVFTQNGYKQAQ